MRVRGRLTNHLAAGCKVKLTRPIKRMAFSAAGRAGPEKVNLSGLTGFDADPGKKMPNYQNTAIQIALKHEEKTAVKTQTS